MAGVAKPLPIRSGGQDKHVMIQSLAANSQVEDKHAKRGVFRPKPRQTAQATLHSRPRRIDTHTASWVSKWRTRRRGIPPRAEDQTREGVPEPLAVARKLVEQAEKKEQDEREPKLLVNRPVQVGPEVESVNRFYSNYTAHTNVFIFSRLPAYYAIDVTDAGHVRHATHAVAILSASKSLRKSGLMQQARWHYCRAISTLNQALRDPVGVRDDANLVTLFLFGLYEVINGSRGGNVVDLQENVYPHGAGGLELFKYRAEHGLTNEVDKGCFMYFCHAALMETFIQRNRLTPLWPTLETVETPWSKGPILEPLVRQVVDFKKAFDPLAHVEGEKPKWAKIPPEELIELLRVGVGLSKELDAAVAFIGFSSIKTNDRQEQAVFNGLFILSDKTSAGIARSHYRALRIYLLERIMDLLSWIRETGRKITRDLGPMPCWSDGVAVIEEIIDDIRTVFGLEGKEQVTAEGTAYRTMTMFWPVVMVQTSIFAGPESGRWVAKTMLELSSNTGFGLGLQAAAM